MYSLGICDLCSSLMSLTEIQEGVRWEQGPERTWLYGYCFWEPEEECRVAHRRCWKALKEHERRSIRHRADEAPRSLGQQV
jgi:hypothetical protein